MEVRFVPKTNNLLNDIEITRRGFARTEFNDTPQVNELLTHLGNYHERESTGKPCHQNNCAECHGASHGADSLRTMMMAEHLGLIQPYLEPKSRFDEQEYVRDDWMVI